MKKLLLTLVAFCAAFTAAAQTPDTTAAEGYRFTDVKLIPMTPVKDQSRSGTCWCYSTLSFLEGEILRAGGAPRAPLRNVDRPPYVHGESREIHSHARRDQLRRRRGPRAT